MSWGNRAKCVLLRHKRSISCCHGHLRHLHRLRGIREKCVQICRSCNTVKSIQQMRIPFIFKLLICSIYVTASSTVSTTSAASSTATSAVIRSVTFSRDVSVFATIVASLGSRFRTVASDVSGLVAIVAWCYDFRNRKNGIIKTRWIEEKAQEWWPPLQSIAFVLLHRLKSFVITTSV